jgi:hypothetical protein
MEQGKRNCTLFLNSNVFYWPSSEWTAGKITMYHDIHIENQAIVDRVIFSGS